MNLYNLSLLCLALNFLIIEDLFAQNPDTLYFENFDSDTLLPAGWSASSNWNVSASSSSSGYINASGNNNIIAQNFSSTDNHYLIYTNGLSTISYTNIGVIWAARRTSAFINNIIFCWSKNGTEWDTVNFINVNNNAIWNLVNDANLIILPVEAEGIENLHLKWFFDGSVSSTGNYRIDDLIITGIPDTITEDFETGFKTQYTRDTIDLKSGKWILDDALTGSSLNDLKYGDKSIRIRSHGILEMYFDAKKGIDSFNIMHGRFGNDGFSEWKLQYSYNCGLSWEDISETVQSKDTLLITSAIEIKKPGKVRIRIVKTSTSSNTNRTNFDNLVLIPYLPLTGPEIVHLPLDNTNLTDDRIITAYIGGDKINLEDLKKPVLWYRLNENNWQYVHYIEKNCSEFKFILPGQPQSSKVQYYFAAEDKNGMTTLPEGGDGVSYDTLVNGYNPPQEVFSYYIYGNKLWSGYAGTNSWSDNNNWQPAGTPYIGDTVVLNSTLDTTNYFIVLPAGNESIEIAGLNISPASGNTITLELPTSNTNGNALILSSDKNAMIIDSGGVFINSSGATSGTGINLINGKLKIKDHGKYIHNTLRAHASIVDALQNTTGTEFGIFEFNIPGNAATSIASSGRIYGSLHLRGNRQYTNSGSSEMFIRGNVVIDSNSLFYPALNSQIQLKGNLIVNGTLEPVLNTGLQKWVFNGNNEQNIEGNGNIILNKNIDLEIDNSNGVFLKKSLTMNGNLILKKGNIYTGEYKISFGESSLNPVENNSALIIGHAIMLDREINTDSISFLGVEISSGLDNIGNVSIERFSGVKGIIVYNNNESIACYWIINSENRPDSGRNLTLKWLSELDNNKNLLFAEVWSKSDTNWERIGSTYNVVSNDPRVINRYVNSFSSWTVTDNNNPLPVELINFKLKKIESGLIRLNWFTSSENNNMGFEVLRKIDHQDWSYVYFVQGQGNSSNIIEYVYHDHLHFNPGIMNVYYKLKQIDYNGHYVYSDIKKLNFSFENYDAIFPNPVNEKLYLNPGLFSKYVQNTITITDLKGVQILKKEIIYSGNTIYIDLSVLKNGIYIFKLENEKKMHIEKIIKI